MLQSTSMGRSLENNRLDKQTESQELFKPGTNFSIEKETPNSQISSDTELEVKKPLVSEKAEHMKSERNGIKPKATNSWKNNVEEEVQNGTAKGTNGNTLQLVSSDSPDTKTIEKSDSPISLSTPNESSETGSQSESPQDDAKSKAHIVPTTSEDEVHTINENTENNRARKKRRYDTRGENGNGENGSMSIGNNKSGEPDENEKPRAEVQSDMKKVEQEFAELKDQCYREQLGELEKEVAMINQGTHRELISRMEEIEQKKKRRLEIAKSRKKYQEEHCHKQYEEVEYMAECEFMSDKFETKRKKLDDMESRKWKMIREKNRLDVLGLIECPGPDHNQLAHRKNKKLSNVAELKYVQMHYGFPAASMLDSLNKSEIEEDLISLGIAREDEAQAVATLSSSSSPKINTISGPPILGSCSDVFLSEADNDIYAGGDRFRCFGQWFTKGDQVLVNDFISGGRYTAKFVTATESEVVIQRPDGSKTRLQMNLLKEGKHQIRLKDS